MTSKRLRKNSLVLNKASKNISNDLLKDKSSISGTPRCFKSPMLPRRLTEYIFFSCMAFFPGSLKVLYSYVVCVERIHRLEEPVSNTTSYGLTTSFFCDGAVEGRNPEIIGACVKHYILWTYDKLLL